MMRRPDIIGSSASELIYTTIRDRIVNKELRPGDRLPEFQIAHECGVSRTPVRDALRKLASEGLVILIPNSGARVSRPTKAEVSGAYDLRVYLEELAVKLVCKYGLEQSTIEHLEDILAEEVAAAKNHDTNASIKSGISFHMLLSSASRNPVLCEFIENILLRTSVYVLFYGAYDAQGERGAEEHRNILRAVARRDSDLAVQLVREHVEHCRVSMSDSAADSYLARRPL